MPHNSVTQYILPLSLPDDYAAERFIISDCNRQAYEQLTHWPDGSASALVLYGPPGAGKTHLAHNWAERQHAIIVEAAALDASEPSTGAAVIEHIEQAEPRALLHRYNSAREQRHALLLTSRIPPAQLPFTLPDLTSRLLSLPTAALLPPDDRLLAGLLRKYFTDRQLKIEEDVIAYLLPRIERTPAAAYHAVSALDAQAIAEQKPVTVPFVRRWLETQA